MSSDCGNLFNRLKLKILSLSALLLRVRSISLFRSKQMNDVTSWRFHTCDVVRLDRFMSVMMQCAPECYPAIAHIKLRIAQYHCLCKAATIPNRWSRSNLLIFHFHHVNHFRGFTDGSYGIRKAIGAASLLQFVRFEGKRNVGFRVTSAYLFRRFEGEIQYMCSNFRHEVFSPSQDLHVCTYCSLLPVSHAEGNFASVTNDFYYQGFYKPRCTCSLSLIVSFALVYSIN